MSASPRRQSQRDFLAYYATLEESNEAHGKSLLDGEDDPLSSDEDPAEVQYGWIDSGIVGNRMRHERLDADAAHRAEEERELQALARRIKVGKVDYIDSECEYESFRRGKRAQATARHAC